jgi:PII-like signaling protein/CBS-domain-containing membrane protein
MQQSEAIQRVRIYINERDATQDRALYLAILEQLRRAGATGATVLRGVAGFGAGTRLLTTNVGEPAASLPMIIEWVDRAERVERVLPLLDALLANALVTVEDVRVYRAALRSMGPFANQIVGAVLDRDVLVAEPAVRVADACRQLLERSQSLLPVLDDHKQVLGSVPAHVLTMPLLPFHLLRALPPAERDAAINALPSRTLADAMDTEPRVLTTETLVTQAVGAMVEWGLDVLPVVERDGQFVGLFAVEQALRAAQPQQAVAGAVRAAEPPTAVRLLMQVAVPTIAVNARATEALVRLFNAPDRYVVLVDNRRPTGMLTEDAFVAQAERPLRDAWLQMLQNPPVAPQRVWEPLLQNLYAAELPFVPVPAIEAQATRDAAMRMLLEQQLERLVVVEEDGRMAGVIGRRGLLRALAQESSA